MDKIAAIKSFTKESLAADLSGHGYDHARRVVTNAEMIMKSVAGVDQEVVLAAAYLHDTIDDKVVSDVAVATRKVQRLLEMNDFSQEQITMILAIIQNMSFSRSLEQKVQLSREGQIVQDADRLDALGAIGIMRTAYFGGSHGHPLHDPEILPIDYQNKADYRQGSTVINHFYEKLLKIADTMHTTPAKAEARRRKAFMEDFLTEFFAEWGSEEA